MGILSERLSKSRSKKENGLWDNNEWFYPDDGDFVLPEVEEYLEENLIKDQGSDDGRNEQPPSNQNIEDHIHAEARRHYSSIVSEGKQEVSNYHTWLMGNINSVTNLKVLESKAKEISEKAVGNYEIEIDSIEEELDPILEDYRKQKAGLANFKRNNKIGTRIADYSKAKEAWIWISAIFLIECITNAFLLRDVLDGGLPVAVSMTLVITAVNVFFGVIFIGEGCRNTNSINVGTKALGWIQIVAFSSFLVVFNILAGHLRDVLKERERLEEFLYIGGDVWDRFTTSLIDFKEPETFLFVAAGFLSFALASWKGYERDDSYPGYGRISRRTDLAKKEYFEHRDDQTEYLKDLHVDYKKELDDLIEEVRKNYKEYDECCEKGRAAKEGLASWIKEIESILQGIVQVYRGANQKARKTKPPKYFGEPLTLSQEVKGVLKFSPPKKQPIGKLIGIVEDVKKKMQDALEIQLKRLNRG